MSLKLSPAAELEYSDLLDVFDAQEALALGLVNQVVDDAYASSLELAARLASHSGKAVEWTKILLLAERKARLTRQMALVDQARQDVMLGR